MAFSLTSNGSWNKTETWLKKMAALNIAQILDKYGRVGVAALASAFPVDTGLSSSEWGYRIGENATGIFIEWTNSDIENGFPVIIMLQYGHGTGTGGYVQGYDYINPAMRPIFDDIANEVWKVVTA